MSWSFASRGLPVPTTVQGGDPYRLYRWWYGSHARLPDATTAALVLQPMMQLFEGIELAGPHLTPSSFAEGLFRAPPAGGGPTKPLQAYGDQGAPPTPSYSWPADYTFIWYDATAKGMDEVGSAGSGLIRYVAGGRRYRAEIVPPAEVPMFSRAGSVTSYPTLPAKDSPPSYPPWPGSPAARST